MKISLFILGLFSTISVQAKTLQIPEFSGKLHQFQGVDPSKVQIWFEVRCLYGKGNFFSLIKSCGKKQISAVSVRKGDTVEFRIPSSEFKRERVPLFKSPRYYFKVMAYLNHDNRQKLMEIVSRRPKKDIVKFAEAFNSYARELYVMGIQSEDIRFSTNDNESVAQKLSEYFGQYDRVQTFWEMRHPDAAPSVSSGSAWVGEVNLHNIGYGHGSYAKDFRAKGSSPFYFLILDRKQRYGNVKLTRRSFVEISKWRELGIPNPKKVIKTESWIVPTTELQSEIRRRSRVVIDSTWDVY